MKRFDVVVVGLGIMGAASLWQLAHPGLRVLGIEAGGPTHAKGSSHGGTRIFRRAYWEGEAYLPLLNLAHTGWERLQSSSDKRLLVPAGGVFIGPRASDIVAGSLRTARTGNIAHESWDAAELGRRLPQFSASHDMQAVFEPGAYAIAAEDARLHMLSEAVDRQAQLCFGSSVQALHSSNGGICLDLSSGQQIQADAVIVTAGPWIANALLPELRAYLTPKRVPIYWFAPRKGCEYAFTADNFPVFLYECKDGSLLYGIPSGASQEAGVKIGFHNRQQLPSDPDSAAPAIDATLIRQISSYVSAILPDLSPQPSRGKWCFYTMSGDESFLLGESQRHAGVYYASACSGHGFKFATGIGALLSSMAQKQALQIDITPFHPSRFGR